MAVACTSPPVLSTEPRAALHIVGSQDVVDRGVFGMPEVLVLDGGTARDVKVNSVYFVRRLIRTAETLHDNLPHTVQTAGWVRVVAANEKMALVSPEHTCSDMRAGDYLEPFVAPVVQEGDVMTPILQAELNFDAYSRVLHGDLERRSAATNEFATIEHGVDRNIRVGTRFAIYRDLQLSQNPLKRIGEAIAVSVGPTLTVVRVTSARDAIFSGDVMVPRAMELSPTPAVDLNDLAGQIDAVLTQGSRCFDVGFTSNRLKDECKPTLPSRIRELPIAIRAAGHGSQELEERVNAWLDDVDSVRRWRGVRGQLEEVARQLPTVNAR